MRTLSIGIASALLALTSASVVAEPFRPGDDRGNFSFRFGRDDRRGDVEGKRASCELYARIAVVQADAGDRFKCGFRGPKWSNDLSRHFRWCRWASRRDLAEEQRSRADSLQTCFNRLGDFDDRR